VSSNQKAALSRGFFENSNVTFGYTAAPHMSNRCCGSHAGPASLSQAPSSSGPTLRPLLSLIQKLFLDIGQKPHEASALHRCLYRALLLGGKARALPAHNAAVRIDELAQKVDVFVIDVPDVILS